mmetsp:Transcript_12552/g.26094  ORF Transcript_12552/g.26094 Transcript_12552/m.26094 type:complete len:240 (-) Transcript_12552:481-1200(-)|eukprot:CAMPEP_0183294964 /NCGR_PEP_ID=MMETSP0160_2-20130417/3088_1 /TAXON_ID=2839 ORGANISM="Odontella Sinensis, Strain Grunow 1884" /NCGR_SAMPLE_ID=MMETSP0160_2 /ASSEMBLY_ACC=CAM_ASM_000250 /LENGTH=239 /DNA_ID=CAMNT_0025456359 /DNA_START=13 /DNA_END=732 /DNA_ORIENTATION=-
MRSKATSFAHVFGKNDSPVSTRDLTRCDLNGPPVQFQSRGANAVTPFPMKQSMLSNPNDGVDVLADQDIFDGVIIAFVLAFGFSFLQSRSSSNFILSRSQYDTVSEKDVEDSEVNPQPQSQLGENNSTLVFIDTDGEVGAKTVFDGQDWKEMSRPENYVWYNAKFRKGESTETSESLRQPFGDSSKKEKRWILVGLLLLFVPIFSFEFFLALSRQFMCGGDPFKQSAWALELCSPHFMD